MKSYLTFALVVFAVSLTAQTFYLGADLSYVNEMEDCGAIYYENEQPKDPYLIFKEHRANVARFRLWHTPTWTNYSTLTDVIKSIGRAKNEGFSIMLDFHYSDTWADPSNQQIPAAWAEITEVSILADSLFNYTYNTLKTLYSLGLLPDMVQIGNETNGNILLKQGEPIYPNDWSRNIQLFQSGISAVQAINQNFGVAVKSVIHIAQPEDAVWWFDEAKNHGFTSYDIIGISYYPGWSDQGIRGAAAMIGQLKETYGKEVLIVETGYPWTLAWADNATNRLGAGNLLNTFGSVASPENQRDFLTELSYLVKENGGMGVIYWEPDWVSTDCTTPWGTGSNWENATFFDFSYNVNAGIGFLDYDYSEKPAGLDSVNVRFAVDMTGVDTTNGVFVTGDFTGASWQFRRMHHTGQNIFEYGQRIPGRSTGAYIFLNNADWGTQYRETVPAECALYWSTHREYIVGRDPLKLAYVWGSCTQINGLAVNEMTSKAVYLFPNPASSVIIVNSSERIFDIQIFDPLGRRMLQRTVPNLKETSVDVSGYPNGIYFVKVYSKNDTYTIHKIVIE